MRKDRRMQLNSSETIKRRKGFIITKLNQMDEKINKKRYKKY